MRVPAEAGLGDATVRVSFDTWKAAHIAPATIRLPVVEPKPKPSTAAERPPRPEPKVLDSEELRVILPHEGAVSGLTYAPDGRLLASLDWNRRGGNTGIHLRDPVTGAERALLPLGDRSVEAWSLQFSPDGRRVAMDLREVRMRPEGGRYERWLAWEIQVWDIESRTELFRFREEQPGSAHLAAFDGHSALLSVAYGEPWDKEGPQDSRVVRLEVETGRMTTLHESRARESWLHAVSPDGRIAVLTLRPCAKTINTEDLLLDLMTGQTRPLSTALGRVSIAATFSPDGQMFVVSMEARLNFWDRHTGEERADLNERHAAFLQQPENERLGRVTDLAYSPDGKVLAAVHEVFDLPSRRDVAEIVLWEPDTGSLRTVLRGHTRPVCQLAFAPDGRTLATGGLDRVVKLWNVAED